MTKLEWVTGVTCHSIGSGDMSNMDEKVERSDRGYRSLDW